MKSFPLVFLFALIGASSLVAQSPAPKLITLEQAVEAAQTNGSLLEARAQLEAAHSRVGQAQSAFLPALDTSASWQRALPQQEQSSGSGYVASAPLDYWNFSIGAHQVIWDFGKRDAALTQAQSDANATGASLRQQTNELTSQTVRAFWSVVFLKQETDSLDQQSRDLVAHLTAVQKRTGSGSGTKYDVLSTQVRVTSLEGQRIETTRLLNQQRWSLARLIGELSPEGWDVNGTLGVTKTDKSLADLSALALGTRAEIAAAQAGVEAADAALRSSLARWTPDLSASVAMGFQNPVLTADNQDLGRPMLNGVVGLTLSLSGLNPAQVASQTDEARHRLEAARANLVSTRSDVAAQVGRAFDDYLSSLSAWENARQQSDQSRQALEAAAAQYELGVISNDIYLNSHLAYEQAKLAEQRVLWTQISAYGALGEAVGLAFEG